MFSYIKSQESDNVWIFTGPTLYSNGGYTNNFITWNKPMNARWIYMLAIGPGSDGKYGQGANSGGAGGGGGATTVAIYPAKFVPDVLYIMIPTGSNNSTNNTTTVANTVIATYPDATKPGYLLVSAAGGTTAGANSYGYTSTNGGLAANNQTIPLATAWGFFSKQGPIGSSGTLTAGAVGINTYTNNSVTAGGASGGYLANGGNGTASLLMTSVNTISVGSTATNTTAIVTGSPSMSLFKPLVFAGGSGGAANTSSAGAGNPGGIGSGGGGGGANSNVSGIGGAGGPGLAMIVVW